jgi:hypothetical protein
MHTSAGTTARLEHDERASSFVKKLGRSKPGEAGAHDYDGIVGDASSLGRTRRKP